MLKELTKDEINDAAVLTWRLFNNAPGRSYPLFQSLAEIEAEYCSRINTKGSALIGYYKGEKLIGVLCYYYQPEEFYLQTTVLVAAEDYNIVINSFLSHINNNHSGYEVYIGITPEYTVAIDELITFGYRPVESSSDLRLSKSCFLPQNVSDNNIERIDKVSFPEYSDFHKAHFDHIYWNTERIQSKIDEWYIFAGKKDGVITGGLFMMVNGNAAEIFGMAMNDPSDRSNAVTLLSKAITIVLNENPELSTVIFFVEDKEEINLYAGLECGFKLNSRYRCYYLKV